MASPMAANLISSRVATLRKQIDDYRAILKSPLDNPSTVYLGDGYFVTMTQNEAKDFLRRKLRGSEQQLKSLFHLGDINDEGLPILDIVEQLDEDGSIISSEVNPTGLGSFTAKKRFLDAKISDDNAHVNDSIPRLLVASETNHEFKSYSQAGIALLGNAEHSNAEQAQNSRSIDSCGDKVEYIENVADTEGDAEDGSNGEFREIHPLDVLELEIFGDESEESDAEKTINFDFANVEEESDEESRSSDGDDSDDSDNAYGWRGGSLFPTDEATQRCIRSHLARASNPSLQSKCIRVGSQDEGHTKKNKDAHVRFASDVDIREFETSPSERKVIPTLFPQTWVSKFRAARQEIQEKSSMQAFSHHESPQKILFTPRTANAPSAALAAAAAVARITPSSDIHRLVTERAQLRHPLSGSPLRNALTQCKIPKGANTPKYSPVKPPRTTTSEKSTQARLWINPAGPEGAPLHGDTNNKTLIPHSENESKVKLESAELNPQESKPKGDLKERITQDAEEIFENSFIPDDEFLKLHFVDDTTISAAAGATDSKKQDVAPENSTPILSSVIERSDAHECQYESDDDQDNVVNMTEIKQEYQRLRQKLIYESGGFKAKDCDKAIEPIEPDGTTKKMSRFKAARAV